MGQTLLKDGVEHSYPRVTTSCTGRPSHHTHFFGECQGTRAVDQRGQRLKGRSAYCDIQRVEVVDGVLQRTDFTGHVDGFEVAGQRGGVEIEL